MKKDTMYLILDAVRTFRLPRTRQGLPKKTTPKLNGQKKLQR